MQSGVDKGGVVLGAGEERGAAGQEREQSRSDISVHGQSRLCGTQTLLQEDRETRLNKGS